MLRLWNSTGKRLFEESSCQEQRVCDSEWQARCHEGQREEYHVNARNVNYSLVYHTGCFELSVVIR